MNEPQTRLELIDPSIRAAGWTKANNCQMLVEQSACEFAPGRVGKVRGKALRADYILTYRGRRLDCISEKLETLQQNYSQQISDCVEMRQAILREAFEGRL
ncbi:MAG: hypothetical protein II863_14560 [Kiritimatiellae bacterium]|nr:hypothetical protein [Kiritimatiellia bacterium]